MRKYHILSILSIVLFFMGIIYLTYQRPNIIIWRINLTKLLFIPLIFMLAYLLRKKAIVSSLEYKNKKISANYDDKIVTSKEDKLNRDKLAKSNFYF
ncbi:hypothetical protein C7959_1543 [Orenia marismortui]|uniref:Uncharacterized protein n=1 Tax=Orenia marismortui TaxID=46469 RepID=A0A4R8GGV4_9FIRM|nr:hypothetical protein C7959_1543 [Orenia marismortui]